MQLLVRYLAIALTLLTGCSWERRDTASTQLVARIDTDARVGDAIQSLRVRTASATGALWTVRSERVLFRAALSWPMDVVLVPSRDEGLGDDIEVVVDALDAAGQVLVRARSITQYVANEARVLTVWLAACGAQPLGTLCGPTDCLGTACTTCVEGQCGPTPVLAGDSLPDFVAGSARDAGVSTVDDPAVREASDASSIMSVDAQGAGDAGAVSTPDAAPSATSDASQAAALDASQVAAGDASSSVRDAATSASDAAARPTDAQSVVDAQTSVGSCAAKPGLCLNGAQCVDGVSAPTCVCAAGYTGTNCQDYVCQATTINSAASLSAARRCTEIRGDLFFAGGLETVTASDLPALTNVSGAVNFDVPAAMIVQPRTRSVTLGALVSAGGLYIVRDDTIRHLSFPKLKTVGPPGRVDGAVTIMVSGTSLVSLDLPAVTTIHGQTLLGVRTLCKVNMPNVAAAGEAYLRGLPKVGFSQVSALVSHARGPNTISDVGCCVASDGSNCQSGLDYMCSTITCQ